MIERQSAVNWLIFLCLMIVWGSSFVALKYALETVGPYWIAAGRIVVAALVLAALAALSGHRWPRGAGEWLVCVLLGLVGNTIPFVLIGWGTMHVPSGTAGLMMATGPPLTLLLAIAVLPDERATLLRMLGLLLGFCGVAMVIAGRGEVGVGTTGTGRTVWPYLALIGGTTCYAVSTIAGRASGAIPVMTRSVGALACASLGIVPMALLAEPLPAAVTLPSALGVIYLAVFPTALATIGIFWLLARSSAGFVAQANYLVPVTAVVLGAALFGEHLGWLQYTGTVVILFGIAIAENAFRRRTAAEVPKG